MNDGDKNSLCELVDKIIDTKALLIKKPNDSILIHKKEMMGILLEAFIQRKAADKFLDESKNNLDDEDDIIRLDKYRK